MRTINAKASKELKLLRKRGVLKGEDLVKFARDPATALHSEFLRYHPGIWDDTAAAHQYRLMVARRIIVSVEIKFPEASKPTRMFVSLRSDQKQPGGGYRETVKVLSDAELRQELLAQAKMDFEYWKNKYEALKELIPIFRAGKKVFKSG